MRVAWGASSKAPTRSKSLSMDSGGRLLGHARLSTFRSMCDTVAMDERQVGFASHTHS